MALRPNDNEAFRRFLRRVWREDVARLLQDRRASQRKKTARLTGKAAAATGLLVDGLFGLKGKPFTRFMTVMGTSVGAMLPDVWDWKWLRESANPRQKQVVTEQVRRRAAELPEAEALELFGLDDRATREQLKQTWRDLLHRWHPDKATDEAGRAEYNLRFLAYKTAYERLCRVYDEGRLPWSERDHQTG
ncbi:MAG: J domain-containing protein [Phycisphaerae bacterium]|nr:J domain-containing protein [Phycisphaerae bacterium]